jgi:hypothetical protein
VIEVLKGNVGSPAISLPGYLSDTDDFNEMPVPYEFVRKNGRTGICFANTYRRGAEHLLALKRRPDGAFTVNWYALGPTNEQLRGVDDPWLRWVRKEVKSPSPRKRP